MTQSRFVDPPLLLLFLGLVISCLGIVARRLKADKVSRVILWVAQIPFSVYIAWWFLVWLASSVLGHETP